MQSSLFYLLNTDSYTKKQALYKKKQEGSLKRPPSLNNMIKNYNYMAGAAGFEPATCGFGDRCSTN